MLHDLIMDELSQHLGFCTHALEFFHKRGALKLKQGSGALFVSSGYLQALEYETPFQLRDQSIEIHPVGRNIDIPERLREAEKGLSGKQ